MGDGFDDLMKQLKASGELMDRATETIKEMREQVAALEAALKEAKDRERTGFWGRVAGEASNRAEAAEARAKALEARLEGRSILDALSPLAPAGAARSEPTKPFAAPSEVMEGSGAAKPAEACPCGKGTHYHGRSIDSEPEHFRLVVPEPRGYWEPCEGKRPLSGGGSGP